MKRLLVMLSVVLAALAGVVGVAGVSSAAFGATKPALTIAVSPMAATANSTGNALTFKVTASSSVSGQLSLVVPAGWTAPQASNPALPGYVVVQRLTCASAGPGPTSITGSGPWTMDINFSCATNKSFSLTYSNVTAPAATGSYQFTTQANTGSGWQPLSAQPAVKVNPAPVHLLVTGLPGTATTGAANSFTVTALNSNNNVVTGYTGTVHFTSTDAQALLPANYTFTAANAGKHTFTPGVTFKTAGSQTLTATDTSNSSITGTSPAVTVAAPPAATHFSVAGLPATAGVADTFTVKALGSSGNVVTGYTGTVHFTSTDGQAVLPANYTFTAADAGVHTFTVTFKTAAASQTLTATDTVNSSVTGTSPAVTVTAAAASQFAVSVPSGVTAGAPFNVTVTAEDQFGNTVTGYSGTAHFASSDPNAVLPANYTFTAADAGKHTFTAGVTFEKAGSQTLTVTDTSSSSVAGSQSVTVGSGSATQFSVTGLPATATAGTAYSVTVRALDAYGNLAAGYAGRVGFSSTDGAAVLPADYTFTSADAGVHVFTVTLNTAGSQTVTVTDTASASLTGAQSVTVAPGAATQFYVTSGQVLKHEPFVTAGTATSFTVTAEDSSGNVVTGYTGTVHFTSTDLNAVLPGDYTFTSADAGTHTFTAGVTFTTAGQQTLTATDTSSSSVTGSLGFGVSAGPAAVLGVTGLANPSAAGAAQPVTVTAYDAYGNIATGYTGTVAFTSSDGQAALPANYTFTSADAGVHVFTATLNTAGPQTLTAADTVTSSVTGAQSVTVAAGAVTRFLVGPSGKSKSVATAGIATSVPVTAEDSSGNVVTGYTGTVHFTSSDGQAVLPGDYTFTAADAGTHTFTVTFETAASQTLTVTDTANSSVTGSLVGVKVVAGPAAVLVVTGLASPSGVGAAQPVTVTAQDAYNNIAAGYAGTVHFTSTDGAAVLPADYTFTAADAGSHTFTPGVTFNTAGSQTLTVTDTADSSITGISAPVTVMTAVTQFSINLAPTLTAGIPGTFTVTALDANNQVVPGYTGTVHFTSTDPNVALPADYTFTAADAGSHTFTGGVTFNTVGQQTVSVADVANPSVVGSSPPVIVSPGVGGPHFEITGLPPTSPAGALNSFTVTVLDANNQVMTGYTGTVHFASDDPQAFLPGPYTFTAADAGSHTFTPGVAFYMSGPPQTLTVIDASNPPITGSANVGVGSCSNGQLTSHLNGLGQTFADCVPQNTYDQTQATEAALASLLPGANPTQVQVLTCPGPGNNEVVATMVPGLDGQSAAWDYSGSDAGHVVEFPPGQFACPGSTDPTWG